jgi:aryl-alcohol dehydrogenase-like predicted oxidoreductase
VQYQSFGATGLCVSKLAMGTMAFGGDADEAMARTMFDRCRDAGINLFDCADVYNQGRAEEILGRLISGCRDELIITSKCYFPSGPDVNARGGSRRHIIRAAEASLRRLNTDRIDLYFLHRYPDDVPLEEALRALETLVNQGKILYPAVSNFAAWQTAKALGIAAHRGWAPVVCTQPMYNLAKRQAESEIFPMARAEQLGVLTYSPLGGGLLSGKYSTRSRPDRGRLIDNAMYQTRYGAPSNFAIAEAFEQLARELGHQPASLAIAWVASHPAVTAPIVGARNLEQLEPCLSAADLSVETVLRERIAALSPTPAPATDRNEEGSQFNYAAQLRRKVED